MEFITHNDTDKWFSDGTYLQGYLTADYNDLVEAFGKPNTSDGYKSDAGWDIKWEDGTVSTIYNWKNGNNYNQDGTKTESIIEWNVGGKNKKALEYVLTYLGKKGTEGHKSLEHLQGIFDLIKSSAINPKLKEIL